MPRKKNSTVNRLLRRLPNKGELLKEPLKHINKFINTKLSAILYSIYPVKVAPLCLLDKLYLEES